MNFGNVGLLIIKGFANVKEVEHYRSVLARYSGFKLPACVRPIMISVDNFQKLLNEGRSFEDYFRAEQEAVIKEKERLENPDASEEATEAEEAENGSPSTEEGESTSGAEEEEKEEAAGASPELSPEEENENAGTQEEEPAPAEENNQ